ncbi:MAG: GldG family protein, partial [Planctomycetota bacterium]
MGGTFRTIAGVVLVGIITFCAIIICQDIGRTLRVDVTELKLYTLSDGTKSILAKLNQPLKLRLFYTKTATRKARDEIRYYNNYFYFVQSLLEEYTRAAKGMIKLDIIDPRPFSDEEEEALRYGLRRFPISEEENFFFGLVLQTEFGVVKTIPFFSPQ